MGTVVAALACLVLLPTVAHAQSAIAGVVRDTSGAVLPGVSVEAASDVLIEKTRTVVTDGAGQYKIVDLRPGTYVVTFSLPGFATIKREGIELPSNFTAAINADMKVGSLEESITVSGDAPVVDVQTAVHSQTLNREAIDAIPTGRTIQGMGQLIVGVTDDVKTMAASGARLSGDASEIVAGIRNGRGLVGKLMTDDELYRRATAIAQQTEETATNAKQVLDQIALIAQTYSNAYIRVEGNTDSLGNAASNVTLSEARARAVVNYLINKYGFSRGRFIPKGNGPYKPVASNATTDGRSKNRRTDIMIIPK
jgi:flagellar motor protein MotB